MKELSLFHLKNSLGAKMRRGIRTLCNGDDSTSTLNNVQDDHEDVHVNEKSRLPTLEEMIVQLEKEEEAARKEKKLVRGRMSCVNNSDILRSARNALNQYPRFSLDGKDAMYRSSFNTFDHHNQPRNSVCCDRGLRRTFHHLPPKVAGERVVWCKPGVVAKLMGLEAMPVPILTGIQRKEKLSSVMKRHQTLWRAGGGSGIRRGRRSGSSSRTETEFYIVNPVAVVEPPELARPTWPTRRFV